MGNVFCCSCPMITNLILKMTSTRSRVIVELSTAVNGWTKHIPCNTSGVACPWEEMLSFSLTQKNIQTHAHTHAHTLKKSKPGVHKWFATSPGAAQSCVTSIHEDWLMYQSLPSVHTWCRWKQIINWSSTGVTVLYWKRAMVLLGKESMADLLTSRVGTYECRTEFTS